MEQKIDLNTTVFITDGIYKGHTGKITSYNKEYHQYIIDDTFAVHESCLELCIYNNDTDDNKLFNDLYVTYKQAVLLSKLGFNYRCFYYYTEDGDGPENNIWLNIQGSELNHNGCLTRNVYSAPTLDLVCRWLRGKKYYIIIETDNTYGIINSDFSYKIYHQIKGFENNTICVNTFNTYEKALSNAIDKVLDILCKECI